MSDASATESSDKTSPPLLGISLPKGGGAIQGMGEKFNVNPATGTGSMTIPLPVSPARGLEPSLTLSYDSGNGNGPFGFGWALSLASISRRTSKGLPRYADLNESDVFVISGLEDLVPVVNPDGSRYEDSSILPGYAVRRYRPRIEGPFSRIERCSSLTTPEDVFWRVLDTKNLLTIYGNTPESRIFNPLSPGQIFTWFVSEIRDQNGNVVSYRYKGEDGSGIDPGLPHQQHRGRVDDKARTSNRYLKSVLYGNKFPLLDPDGNRPHLLDQGQLQAAEWLFEITFDYGEHDKLSPSPSDPGIWAVRADPFSSYRSRFEIRTSRLCSRVLLFHHFKDEAEIGNNYLVKSVDLTYALPNDPRQHATYSFVTSMTTNGYRKQNGTYLKVDTPPVEFEYTQPEISEIVETASLEAVENLPSGFASACTRWVDLFGEGIPGALTEDAAVWFYKHNITPLNETVKDGVLKTTLLMSPTEVLQNMPNLAPASQFFDLLHDGSQCFVNDDIFPSGFYRSTFYDNNFSAFSPFNLTINHSLNSKDITFLDVDGDGVPELVIAGDEVTQWHSFGESGFGPPDTMDRSLERSHHMLFSNDSEVINLSDFSGDGLSDIVRIRNGECCYWPNLGYGRFGSKITLDNSPYFDHYDQFASKRILLADIDGSGTTDIIYLHRDGPRLYFNQSGNGLSDARTLKAFPMTDSSISVTTADLHGDGTSCLVLSSSRAADSRQPLRYLKLMKTKPHLMTRMTNNLGASTEIKYATSTKFYLQDKRNGSPWITRLPFPVHVVESVVTQDEISKNRFVSRNEYHHGYYDGVDREFRGFGMIEQWDTEYIASLNVDGSFDFVNEDPVYRLPPVHTKKWFHLGVFIDSNRISRHYEQEYYYPDESSTQWTLPDTTLPPDLDIRELHDACRALKGTLLRAETYTDDAGIGSPDDFIKRSKIPHAVIETRFSLRLVQHKLTNGYAVFFPSQSESLSYNIDRNPSDPRIAHSLVLESNDFGQPLKQLTISYGRLNADPALQVDWDKTMQTQTKIAFHESKMTNAIDDSQKFPFSYRCPSVCESSSYELTGFEVEKPGYPFQLRFWTSNNFEQIVNAQPILYESVPDLSVKQKRLLKSQRILFRKDDLSSSLPLYELESLAFGGESYKMAFTSSMLAIYLQRDGTPLLPDLAGLLVGSDPNQGGYQLGQNLKASGLFPTTDPDGSYWIPSGQLFFSSDNDPAKELQYAKKNFCLPRRFRNPYNVETYAAFDTYNLLLVNSIDGVGNQVTVGDRDQSGKILNNGNDYRVLQPRLMTDINRNRTEVRFDALGRVVAQAVMGKKEQTIGDSVDGIVEDEDRKDVLAYLANPMQGSEKFLGNASSRILYDLFSYMRTKKTGKPLPAVTCTMKRVVHSSDVQGGAEVPIVRTFAYSDGFGRIIQSKAQFKPGPIPQRDSKGNIVLDDQGQPVMTDGKTDPRWGVDGWTIYNNKGKPVRKYDPFFSDLHDFEFGVQFGVSPVIFYDAVERVVATLLPNNTYTKEIFSPWKQISWDSGDTVHLDPRTDSDVSQYTAAYFKSRPNYKTWYSSRTSGDLGPDEKDAADKCTAFAGTPTTSYFDSLGRVFLVAAHQKVVCAGHELDGVDDFLFSRIELDIEGNKRIIRDASIQNGSNRGRIIETHDYDMLGNIVHTFSSERGHSWILKNISGGPMKAWDSRGNIVRSEYDTAARPLRTFLQHTPPTNTTPLPEIMVSRLVYGESHPEAELRNIRNVVYMSLDQSGAATMDRLDFKGNTLEASHRLCSNYKDEIDWVVADKIIPSSPTQALDLTKLEAHLQPMLESETFHSTSTFDALNRPLTLVVPHSDSAPLTTIRIAYDVTSLSTIDCNIRNEKSGDNSLKWIPFITALDYDPKGQRRNVVYGNGVSTDYEYNNVSQLVTAMTRRNNDSLTDRLQNLHYTYDPLWNITKLTDSAKQTYFFRNQIVTPSSSYTYDSLYRLIEATGREHLGQTNGAPLPYSDNDSGRFDTLPGQENAMGLFQEFYVYDEVCNLKKMRHVSSDNSSRGWSRNYVYQEASHIELQNMSDRVTSTSVGSSSEIYMYDAHGNMTRMPHLGGSAGQENIRWDFMDRMKDVDLGGGGTAYYTYNQSGQRVRKVIERGPNLIEERIYLGEIELYRKRSQTDLLLERETLHINDDHQRIAIVESRSGGSAANDPAPPRLIRYQLSDHLQSSSVELDDTARILSYEEYSPYGSTTYQAKTSDLETPKRYRYTGKERDEESGLSYHGARYMASWLGRWITNDPAGMSDGTNLYAYVRGNPIMMHDPSGLAGEGSTPPARKGMTWRLSLDEIWPVGDTDPSITDAERLWRIISPENKQFLWKYDNNMKDNTPPSSADTEPVPSEPIDIKTDPTRMMTKNWGGIKQAAAILRQAFAKTGPKPQNESWGDFKERFNDAVIGNIKKGRSVEATEFRNEFLAQGGVIQKGAELGLSAAEPPPNSPPAPRPVTTPPPPPAPSTPPATPEPTKPSSAEPVESAPTTESGAGEGGGAGVRGKIGNALGGANTVFMAAGTAGSILRSIDQGHPEKAATTALVFTAVTFAAKKVPIVGYAMLAYGTYKNLDSKEAQAAAASARGFVGQYTDNKYVGMAVGGAAQLGEAAYKTAVTDTVRDIKDGIGVLRKWTGW